MENASRRRSARPLTKREDSRPLRRSAGTTVYYSKLGDPGAIWKVPTAGGEETRFLANTLFRYWTVGDKGIYFITREDRFLNVNFIGFATRKITSRGRFERSPAKDGHAGLALSPDGLSLLWTLPEGNNSDIMLVENSRYNRDTTTAVICLLANRFRGSWERWQ